MKILPNIGHKPTCLAVTLQYLRPGYSFITVRTTRAWDHSIWSGAEIARNIPDPSLYLCVTFKCAGLCPGGLREVFYLNRELLQRKPPGVLDHHMP